MNSFLNPEIQIEEDKVIVALVSEKDLIHAHMHAYLLFETLERDETGKDLSLTQTFSKVDFCRANKTIKNSVHGEGKVCVKQKNSTEVTKLLEASNHVHIYDPIGRDLVNPLIKKLEQETIESSPNYCVSGDSSGSIMSEETHNCISWCQEILASFLKLPVSGQNQLIKIPTSIVAATAADIAKAKAKNKNNESKKCCIC